MSVPNDHLFIEGLQVPTRIGTTSAERAFPQVLRLSLRLGLPLENAGRSDRLPHSVDYAAVIQAVRSAITKHPFNLVEAVAETAAQSVFEFAPVQWVEVRVAKKIFPDVEAVGAFVRRERAAGKR